ncbi:MAG: DUF167 domain-containing protein [Chloroflexi bacterium]|nr:MAG: DUF167 domain-containing protein [Chloroflexota bacterium]
MIRPMLRLAVLAHPAARVERVELLDDGSLGVWVRARPVEGQANVAIERAIALALGLRSAQPSRARGSPRNAADYVKHASESLGGRVARQA